MERHRRLIALSGLLLLGMGIGGGLLWVHDSYPVEDRARIGRPLPAMEFIDADGQPVDFEIYRGQKVLAAWVDPACASCREQLQVLEDFRAQADIHGIRLLAIVRRDPALPRDYSPVFSFPLWSDADRQFERTLGGSRVPALLLVDEGGLLRGVEIGLRTLDGVRWLSGRAGVF